MHSISLKMSGKLQLIEQELLKCEAELFHLSGETWQKWLGVELKKIPLTNDVVRRVFSMDTLEKSFQASTILKEITKNALLSKFKEETEIIQDANQVLITFRKSNQASDRWTHS